MAILNRFIDTIVGVPSMRKVRDFRMEAMREMYDPTVFNEIATRQRTRATEGLSDLAEQAALRRVASQAARPVDPSIVGGDAARAMAMSRAQEAGVSMAYGDIAARLAEMDEQMRAQYGDAYAQTVGQQSQMMGMRRAALANEQAMFEEERSMRRRQLGAQALKAGVEVGAALLGVPGGGTLGEVFSKGIQKKSAKRAEASLAQARAGLMPGDIENIDIEPGAIDLDTDIDYSLMAPLIDDVAPQIDYDAMKMTIAPKSIINRQTMRLPTFMETQMNRGFGRNADLSWMYQYTPGTGKKQKRHPMDEDYFLSGYGLNR